MKWITNIGTRVRDVWTDRDEPEHLRVLADTYWRALLLLAAAVVVCAILYGTLKLLEIKADTGKDVILPSGGGSVNLDREELRATLDGFSARQASYEALKKGPPAIPDPSK